MQLFPEKVKNFWNGWEIRVMILFSLLLQIILVIFGSRRKRTKRIWIRILVWSAYMAADSIATFTLGNIATSQEQNSSSQPNHLLQVFWVPFLLLHLGGPDTITAYSLEDNELWLRHLLGFLVQVGIAYYVFLQSWSSSYLTFLAIPIFVSGTIKYLERTLALRSSSINQLKESLLSAPDPGPNIRFMHELIASEQHITTEDSKVIQPSKRHINEELSYYAEAYILFKSFKYLYAGLILGPHEREKNYEIIIKEGSEEEARELAAKGSAEEAFKLIEGELGFMYDVLYTKASIVYSSLGIFVRCVTVLSSVSALIVFVIIINKNDYKPVDVFITYLLLVGAVVLEVYAFIVLLSSDWTKRAMGFKKSVKDQKKWLGSMAQYNLISFCLKDISTTACIYLVQKLLCVRDWIVKNRSLTWKDVNVDLQNFIFSQLWMRRMKIEDDKYIESCKNLLAQRGDNVLKTYHGAEYRWSIDEVEFDHSLLLWHIATDICYYEDFGSGVDVKNQDSKYGAISKCLSDYMLYLLVHRPTMLPKGIGEIKYRDTCAEAIRFFQQEPFDIKPTEALACKALLKEDTDAPALEEFKGDKSQSVLFFGCRLAKQLKSKYDQNSEEKWKMINEVWLEMLAYAANKCEWKEHGQQLRRGGELLTYVRLLMVNLGLSEQYRFQSTESTSYEYFGLSLG